MNIDICKKCNHKFEFFELSQKRYFLNCYDENYISYTISKLTENQFNSLLKYNNYHEGFLLINKIDDLYGISCNNKECPYYVEHQIYDLNKKR